MALEETVGYGLRAADGRAAYDAACKRLLSEKIILAWIMKSCLLEYRDCDVKEIAERYIEGQPQVGEAPLLPDEEGTLIRGADTEDKSLDEGTVFYDIRFNAIAPADGEYIRLIINLEAQGRFDPGYPLVKRGIYYCGRLLSAQYGREFTGPHYDGLKKVYSIWICMNPPEKRKNTIVRYHMVEEPLVGLAQEPKKNYDLLSVILLCLGGPEDGNYDGIIKLLGVLLSNQTAAAEKRQVLEEDFDIPVTGHLEGEVSAMCNLSQGVWDSAWEKAMKQGRAEGHRSGREEGRKEGRKEGAKESLLASIRNLTKNAGMSAEQAMKLLEVPEKERPHYAALLEK